MSDNPPAHYAFVIIGVSGSGKSALAQGLASEMPCALLDGDFLHPRANIMKMAAGQPLNDADRQPWLNAISDAIFAMQSTNGVSLIVCSALKKSYRDLLRQQNHNVFFLYLHGDFALIEQRLKARKGHFFKPHMLTSQFAALEPPGSEEKDVFTIDIRPPLHEVMQHARQLIRQITGK